MTKRELIKEIIAMEYTNPSKALVKSRTNDLNRHRKAFLEKRVEYLKNK